MTIQFLFLVAVFRLRYYEDLTVQDLKKGSFSIDDFTIYIPRIDLPEKDYRNNPELLTAMVVTHLEDIIRNEVQVIEELEDEMQGKEGQIMSVHFGLSSQHIMKHLVNIYEDTQRIVELKSKIKNNPSEAAAYEREIWLLYTKITDEKDNYYREKYNVFPNLQNIYVTFRSMEGK